MSGEDYAMSQGRESSPASRQGSKGSMGITVDTSREQEDDGTCKQLPSHTQGMDAATKYIAEEFLGTDHLKVLHRTLSKGWNKSNGQMQSLQAAIGLMEQYGVVLSPEEADAIAALEEERQIAALVNKMPQGSDEEFQQFFLQLQLLVSTAMRVRKGLEDGQPDQVSMALDDADSTGVFNQILRMAVVQAGIEVQTQKAEYEVWVKDTDSKMARLIRGQEDALTAQKKLASLQAMLHHSQTQQRERAVKAAMNFVGGQTKAFKQSCFRAWMSWTATAKHAKGITEEYEARLDVVYRQLTEAREKQIRNMVGFFNHQGEHHLREIGREVLQLWKTEVDERKHNEEIQAEVDELNAKLAQATGVQKEQTLRVMQRMGSEQEIELLKAIMQCWSHSHHSEKIEKAKKSVSQEVDSAANSYFQGKSEKAIRMMKLALGSSNQVLYQQAFNCWKTYWEEEKNEVTMAKARAEEEVKLAAFGEQRKAVGTSVMERGKYYATEMLLLSAFLNWKMDCRMESTLKGYHAKIEAKRKQLVGVHEMFRSFAGQLESSLRKGQDSDRNYKRRELSKSEGGVSLPDIHKPGTPSSSGKRVSHRDVPQPRAAWA
eukprot:TRINITY_DN102083_c0_g1_i1.p1 TRINITY_DN102083_c0_g1~~TRINITY_DN102083_c0_g1_i1.p1  ORF type:complete len:601 (+),score=167.92 TRINITY_DN102083_c0_g1_i1:102-1904(+)